jgi:hypothetical protein
MDEGTGGGGEGDISPPVPFPCDILKRY